MLSDGKRVGISVMDKHESHVLLLCYFLAISSMQCNDETRWRVWSSLKTTRHLSECCRLAANVQIVINKICSVHCVHTWTFVFVQCRLKSGYLSWAPVGLTSIIPKTWHVWMPVVSDGFVLCSKFVKLSTCLLGVWIISQIRSSPLVCTSIHLNTEF